MAYENKKLKRANELFNEIKAKEKELEALFGDVQEAKRGRPRKQNGEDTSRSMEAADAPGGDAAND